VEAGARWEAVSTVAGVGQAIGTMLAVYIAWRFTKRADRREGEAHQFATTPVLRCSVSGLYSRAPGEFLSTTVEISNSGGRLHAACMLRRG
jgi:hypothetical protein